VASVRRIAPETQPSSQSSERLTAVERLIDNANIDLAACIRWSFFGLAAVIVAVGTVIAIVIAAFYGEPPTSTGTKAATAIVQSAQATVAKPKPAAR
tara:strand:- start:2865 stop:3155 length:291 start_codon:yes stop_codon:yes gene_type:complete